MKEQPSTWDDVRRIAEELELKIHLASMDARERWRTLQPQIAECEKSISRAGKHATSVVESEISSIAAALRRLRDDVTKSNNS